MEERKDEVCDGCEVHEDLLKIVNETLPEETERYDLAELFKVFGDEGATRGDGTGNRAKATECTSYGIGVGEKRMSFTFNKAESQIR